MQQAWKDTDKTKTFETNDGPKSLNCRNKNPYCILLVLRLSRTLNAGYFLLLRVLILVHRRLLLLLHDNWLLDDDGAWLSIVLQEYDTMLLFIIIVRQRCTHLTGSRGMLPRKNFNSLGCFNRSGSYLRLEM